MTTKYLLYFEKRLKSNIVISSCFQTTYHRLMPLKTILLISLNLVECWDKMLSSFSRHSFQQFFNFCFWTNPIVFLDLFVVKEFSSVHSKIPVLSSIPSPLACKRSGGLSALCFQGSFFCVGARDMYHSYDFSCSPFLVVAASVASAD